MNINSIITRRFNNHPMKKFSVIFFVLFIFVVFLIWQIDDGKSVQNKNNGPKERISVILSGFGSKDEEGNWRGESAPFMEKLENVQDVGDGVGMCEIAYEGDLFGSKVLVASTGMAKVNTTACISDILNNYEGRVLEVIFVGIGGITPGMGGVINDNGKYRYYKPAMLGDICVNSLAYDLDLQHYSSDQIGSGVPDPKFWDQTSHFSSRFTKNDTTLSQEILDASAKIDWPAAQQSVRDMNILYNNVSREPKVWGLKECMEATSDLYWNDTRLDLRARELAADFFNSTYGSTISSNEVLIITSMEALPVGIVIEQWNASKNVHIGFAYVRGASNFDHPYFNPDGSPALSGQESIIKLSQSGGVEYAIETASLPVLKMFELRKSNKPEL